MPEPDDALDQPLGHKRIEPLGELLYRYIAICLAHGSLAAARPPPSLAAAMAAPAPTTSDTSPKLAADLNGRPQGDEVQPSATPVESPSSQLPAAMKPAPLLPAETLARSGFALLQQGSAPPLL